MKRTRRGVGSGRARACPRPQRMLVAWARPRARPGDAHEATSTASSRFTSSLQRGHVVVTRRLALLRELCVGAREVLGIIGPTRLNYARIIPMVDYTAKVVGKLIS